MLEVRCSQCPLRRLPLFIPNNADEIALVQSLKRCELSVGSGELLIQEDEPKPRSLRCSRVGPTVSRP